MTSTTRSKYTGEYKDGWYHGHGKYIYPNGVIYEGEFAKGEFHGKGKLIYTNGVYIYKLNQHNLLLGYLYSNLESRNFSRW
jgi:hypothetical protein